MPLERQEVNNMAFNPSQFGATPVTSSPSTTFNPSDYGATPVHTPSPFSQGTDLETMAAKVPASQDMVKNFFSSLGQGVKGTAKALTDPIVGGAKEVTNDTSQAFHQVEADNLYSLQKMFIYRHQPRLKNYRDDCENKAVRTYSSLSISLGKLAFLKSSV